MTELIFFKIRQSMNFYQYPINLITDLLSYLPNIIQKVKESLLL